MGSGRSGWRHRTALGRWPIGGLGIVLASLVGWCVAGARAHAAEDAAEAASGEVRVQVGLSVKGELLAPAGRDVPPVRQSVGMTANFDFDERPAAGDAVVRNYAVAEASLDIDGRTTRMQLAADARRLLVARQGQTPVPYLAEGYLSGEEAELLETPFDAVLIDALLPRGPVPIGQTWDVSGDVTAGLLCIDTVESGGLEARIQEVSAGRAQVAVSGIVDGAVDGVPTHLTVEGSFTVDVRADGVDANAESVAQEDEPAAEPSPDQTSDQAADDQQADQQVLHACVGRIRELSAVIIERRQASHVAPGFEVEARIEIRRSAPERVVASDETGGDDEAAAAEKSAAQTDGGAVAGADRSLRRRGPGGPGLVWYRDASGRFDLVHDSRWRRVEDGAHGLVMRLVDRGALVGQCSITALPGAAGGAASVADVQRDIQRSLAGQAARVDESDESVRDDGVRVVRLVLSGTAEQLPFRWIHYVLEATDGSRVNVTFMFEDSVTKRFAEADRSLVGGLRLPADAGGEQPVARQARGTPEEGGGPAVAR